MHPRRNNAVVVLVIALLVILFDLRTAYGAARGLEPGGPAIKVEPSGEVDDRPPRLALLIGIKNYSKSWWDLPYVSIDLANMIRACLRSGIDSQYISVVTDVSRKELEDQLRKSGTAPETLGFKLAQLPPAVSTDSDLDRTEEVDPGTYKGKISTALENLSLTRPDDTMLVYFSGHGVTLDDARYLAMPTSNVGRESTMYSVEELLVRARNWRGSAAIVAIIDACAAIADGKPIPVGNDRSHWRLTVLYAARPNQFSFSTSANGSIYTYYLSQVLSEPRRALEEDGVPKELHASHVCSFLRRSVDKAVQKGISDGTLHVPEARKGKRPFDMRQLPTSTLADDQFLRTIE